MTSTASRFVGDIPYHYDRELGPVIFEPYAEDIAGRAVSFKPSRVLELAAGTGIVSRKLRDALPEETQIIITDLNPPMLEIAREKFNAEENVEFLPADAMQLELGDQSVDLIVCQFGVMFFPDKRAAFKEARRVLRKGGGYILNAWGSTDENPFSKIAVDLCHEFFPEDPPQFYKTPFSYPDVNIAKQDMEAGGFKNVTGEAVTFEQQVDDWDAFARGLVFGNALIDELKARGGVTPEEFKEALAQRLRETFGTEPSPMPLEANVLSGRRGRLF